MAKFSADAGLAAMSQRAHDILTKGRVQSMGLTPTAEARTPSPIVPTYAPKNIRATMPSIFAGLAARFSNGAASINPYPAPTAQIMAARLASAQRDLGGLDQNPQYTTPAIIAAANRYAQGRSYAGSPYVAHQVMQEGQITYRNGKPGVMVKYMSAGGGGGSTEWTPI